MNLTHPAVAAAAAHRGLGMAPGPLGMTSSIGMSPYHSAALHARSPFAIQELLGLGQQDMSRAPHMSSLPHGADGMMPGSGCLSRSLASPVIAQEACFGGNPPGFPTWRPNFMTFGGTHPQNVLSMGVSPYRVPRPPTDPGSGKGRSYLTIPLYPLSG